MRGISEYYSANLHVICIYWLFTQTEKQKALHTYKDNRWILSESFPHIYLAVKYISLYFCCFTFNLPLSLSWIWQSMSSWLSKKISRIRTLWTCCGARLLLEKEGKSINITYNAKTMNIVWFFLIPRARFSLIFLKILKGYNVAGVN